MSWGVPPWLQALGEKRYWAQEAPLLGEMMGLKEGDHSSFVEGLFTRKKYTHHPIGLIHELRENPAFRHLTLERLVEAVYSEMSGRGYYGCGVETIQIDPEATRYFVALGVGLSCRACDNLIFEGNGLSLEVSKPPWEKRWEFIDNTLRKLVRDQYKFYFAVHSNTRQREWVLPVFCENCFVFTNSVPDIDHWSYRDTHTIKQLLAVFEGRYCPPKRRRSSPRNSTQGGRVDG